MSIKCNCNEGYYTLAQASQYLGTTKKTLMASAMPFVMLDRRTRVYSYSTLRAWELRQVGKVKRLVRIESMV